MFKDTESALKGLAHAITIVIWVASFIGGVIVLPVGILIWLVGGIVGYFSGLFIHAFADLLKYNRRQANYLYELSEKMSLNDQAEATENE